MFVSKFDAEVDMFEIVMPFEFVVIFGEVVVVGAPVPEIEVCSEEHVGECFLFFFGECGKNAFVSGFFSITFEIEFCSVEDEGTVCYIFVVFESAPSGAGVNETEADVEETIVNFGPVEVEDTADVAIFPFYVGRMIVAMANGFEAFAFFEHAGSFDTFSSFVDHFANVGNSGSVEKVITVSLGNAFNVFAGHEMIFHFAAGEEFINLGFFFFAAGEAISGTVEVSLAFTHSFVFRRLEAGVEPIEGIITVEVSVNSPRIFEAVFFVNHHCIGFAVFHFFETGSVIQTSFNAESDEFMFG